MRTAHPVSTMRRVHELYDAGWGYRKIQTILSDEGFEVPGDSTIKRWTDPDYADRQAKRHRERQAQVRAAQSDYRWPAHRGPLWRIGRMRVLREIELSYADIAKVMSFDFPDVPLTRHEVERAITENRLPRRMRKAAA